MPQASTLMHEQHRYVHSLPIVEVGHIPEVVVAMVT